MGHIIYSPAVELGNIGSNPNRQVATGEVHRLKVNAKAMRASRSHTGARSTQQLARKKWHRPRRNGAAAKKILAQATMLHCTLPREANSQSWVSLRCHNRGAFHCSCNRTSSLVPCPPMGLNCDTNHKQWVVRLNGSMQQLSGLEYRASFVLSTSSPNAHSILRIFVTTSLWAY